MKRFAMVCAFLALSTPGWAVSKEIIQLQQMVQLLSDQVRSLNQLVIERLGTMKDLVEKSTDSTNKLQASLESVQRTLQSAMAQQSTSTGQRLDSQQTQLQRVADSVEELKARQARLTDQIAQMKTLLETIQTPPTPVQPVAAPPVPPDELYNNALRDLYSNKAALAMAEFQDYLKLYPAGERAENCQFYIGEIHYQSSDFAKAIEAYTDVIDKYPKGNKTASAHLKKGYALLEVKQKDAGVKELRTLINRFPSSEEAKRAKERITSLGLTANATPARPSGKSKRR